MGISCLKIFFEIKREKPSVGGRGNSCGGMAVSRLLPA